MKKTILILLLVVLLTGCNLFKQPVPVDNNQNQPVSTATPTVTPVIEPLTSNELLVNLANGQAVEEALPLNLTLPDNIKAEQIQKYFKLGDIYLALVLRPSMNIPLESLPVDFNPAFSHVLAARVNDSAWTTILSISDKDNTNKNNPYYLWSKDKNIYLSVVDQNGAGSGEGMMKVLTLNNKTQWVLDGCYYFGLKYRDVSLDGDYLAFSQYTDKAEKRPLAECSNLILDNNPMRISVDKSLGGYWQWALPADEIIVENYNKQDCFGLANAVTMGGDLLSTLIVDNDFRQQYQASLNIFSPSYIEALEKSLAKHTQTTAQSDFYSFYVCHLADNLDLAAGYYWPMDKKFIWDYDLIDDAAKQHLFIINKEQISEMKGMAFLDNTLTGGEVSPCQAQLVEKQIQWSCIVAPGFALDKEGNTIGINYKHWLYDLNGGLIKSWEEVKKVN